LPRSGLFGLVSSSLGGIDTGSLKVAFWHAMGKVSDNGRMYRTGNGPGGGSGRPSALGSR
jgi:hypothetical protein